MSKIKKKYLDFDVYEQSEVDTISGTIVDQIPEAGISEISEDTTPQLGGNLDINEKSIVCEFGTLTGDHTASGDIITGTAGENLVFGNFCYLKSDGKFWKAKADAVGTTKGMLVMALETISATATGSFLKKGFARDDTWNWTVAAEVWLSNATAGAATQTQPSTSNHFVRLLGYGKAGDYLEFNPSKVYVKLS